MLLLATQSAFAALAVTGFSPGNGPAYTLITITGTGFSTTRASNAIKLGAVTFTPTAATATQLTCKVPADAQPGASKISVTVGGVTATSTDFFTVNPTFSSFSPASGVAGTQVTISGTNLSSNPYVQFSGNAALVSVYNMTATQFMVDVPSGATSGPITVKTFAGNGQSLTSSTNFTITLPTVTGFSPAIGPEGTQVTINGTNFDVNTPTNNGVSFNGVAATVAAATATSLTVNVPTGATTGLITVTLAGNSGSSATNFTVTPAITGLSPTSGNAGSTVYISGTTFGATPAANVVKFNGTTATVTAASTTLLTVTAPNGVTTGPITVTANGQTATSASNFFVLPTITSFTPTAGPAGTVMTITGTNFSGTPSQNLVQFVNLPSYMVNATVTAATPTSLTVTVPGGVPYGTSYSITVSVQNGPTVTSSNTYLLAQTPTIASFSPTLGPVGTSVTISGSGFSATPSANAVKFNGTAATVTAASGSSLTATVPSGATTGPITVKVNTMTATSASNYTVGVVQPTITSFTPTSGIPGSQATVLGTHFTNTASYGSIKINGIFQPISSGDDSSLVFNVAANATSGPIVVTRPDGASVTSVSSFTVLAPTISSLSTTSGAEGTQVTINGTNFSSNTLADVVKFNGVAATVTGAGPTLLITNVPVGATTGPITVTVGVQTATSATFTVIPTLTSFTPTSGNAGTTVFIYGTTFGATPAANTVTFNGTTATVTAASTTALTVTVPNGVTTGAISVTANGQTVTTGTNYFYVLPAITSFSPTVGQTGTAVTITGTNFSAIPAQNAVRFVNLPSYTFFPTITTASPTSLTVLVPGYMPYGNYSITLSVQNSPTVTSASTFQLAPKPQIDSFAPTLAPPNVTVIISGSGFSAKLSDNVVKFNGIQATVSAATGSSLTVKVPAAATSGLITVYVNSQLATSASNFTVGLPAPASITVPATTDWPSITISWAASLWAASYQIDAQTPDGNWYIVDSNHPFYAGTQIQDLANFYGPSGYGPFANHTIYKFRVRACRYSGGGTGSLCSAYTQSSGVDFEIPPPPAAPASVTLPQSSVEVGKLFEVDWVPGSGGGAVKYNEIFYTTRKPGCTPTDELCWDLARADPSTVAYKYAPTQPGTYYIGVSAVNGGGQSTITLSDTTLTVFVPKSLTTPLAPEWVRAAPGTTTPVEVSWQKSDSSGNAPAPDHYQIQRQYVTGGGAWTDANSVTAQTGDPLVLTYDDPAATVEGAYLYRIRACLGTACSGWTTTLWAVVVDGSGHPLPVVSIYAPTSGASYAAPASIVIGANATVNGDTMSRVEFYNGSIMLCSASAPGPYTCTWSNVAAGTYSLTARAYATQGGVAASGAVSVTVTAGAATPEAPTSVTVPSDSASLSFDVTWSYDQSSVPAATSFTLQRVNQSGVPSIVSSAISATGSPMTFHETAPSGGQSYYYQVASCNGSNCSAYTRSNSVQIGTGMSTETFYFHHTNAQGSVVATTNAEGQIVSASTYRPFGTRVDRPVGGESGSADPSVTHLGFTGKWHDEQLKLDYFGARYYDPMYTQFLSLDPAMSSFNRYAYANGNPLRYIDIDGRESTEDNGSFLWGMLMAAHDVVTPYAAGMADPDGIYIDPQYDRLGPGPGHVAEGGYKFASTLLLAEGARGIGGGAADLLVAPSVEAPLLVPQARTFTSPDPLVGELATKIDALYPGHVVGVNVPVQDAEGNLLTDLDILLQNGVVQVKSGGGKGLTSQLLRTEEATGLPAIGYGPDLKPSILRSCVATNCEQSLFEVIAP